MQTPLTYTKNELGVSLTTLSTEEFLPLRDEFEEIFNIIESTTGRYWNWFDGQLAIRPSVLRDVSGFDFYNYERELRQFEGYDCTPVRTADNSITAYGLMVLMVLFRNQIGNVDFLLKDYQKTINLGRLFRSIQHSTYLRDSLIANDKTVDDTTAEYDGKEYNVGHNESLFENLCLNLRIEESYQLRTPLYFKELPQTYIDVIDVLRSSIGRYIPISDDVFKLVKFDYDNDNVPALKVEYCTKYIPEFPADIVKKVNRYKSNDFLNNRFYGRFFNKFNAQVLTPMMLAMLCFLKEITYKQYKLAVSDIRLIYESRPNGSAPLKNYLY